MLLANRWEEYKVIDTGFGEKLEVWDDVILRRPDPQVIWAPTLDKRTWEDVHATYLRSSSGGGYWENKKKFSNTWNLKYKLITGKTIKFHVEPTGFKHTGIFPEQAVNWDWMASLIENRVSIGDTVKVLNLFAYTGGATLACASAGANVCHVDASKGMVSKAKENANLSGLGESPIRYIVDDVLKFVQREIRRGNQYEAIIMDPPSYGRGPNGEVWKIENELDNLIKECAKILSDKPLFFLVNSYTTGLAPTVQANLLIKNVFEKYKFGKVTSDEIGIPVVNQDIILPCGASGRWQA